MIAYRSFYFFFFHSCYVIYYRNRTFRPGTSKIYILNMKLKWNIQVSHRLHFFIIFIIVLFTLAKKYRKRAILKNGECNIVQSKLSQKRLRFLQDTFTSNFKPCSCFSLFLLFFFIMDLIYFNAFKIFSWFIFIIQHSLILSGDGRYLHLV